MSSTSSMSKTSANSFIISAISDNWIGNDQSVLGYKSNINIISQVPKAYDTLHSSYLEDYDISGNPVQYPYDTLDLFNSNDIINSLST